MSKITIWIPSMPQRSYSYRRGDCQVIHDDNANCIIIDGGEDDICNKAISYCKSHGISHITYILSHWHYDHDRGMKLLLESSIIVDKIYCPPPSDLRRLTDSDAKDDYSRAMSRIALAESLKKPIVYPPADKYMDIKVGLIACRIWRRSVRPSENADYQVNNTSLCCYFPELYYATTGDTINAFDAFLNTKPGPITVWKIPHHGNACTNNPCSLLKAAGGKICWYNHAESYGTPIGGDSFSHWGAKYCKDHGFICLRPFYAITMTAADKRLTITQNGSKWAYDIPYTGVVPEGWVKNVVGYWYQYSDGGWATNWAKIDGNWYYFGSDGYRKYGWVYVNGYWYWLDPETGIMQTGWIEYKGKRCYLDGSGKALCNCVKTIDGKSYRFDSQCYAVETDEPDSKATTPVIHSNDGFKGYNVTKRADPILYIVIHYTGSDGGTAKNNIDYFNRADRQASADFFVGYDGEIWQYNPNIKGYYSWHCGGGKQSSRGGSFFGKCKNANSIGVEMCTRKRDGNWIFEEKTVAAARQLVMYLMETYNVPQKNVIRHFDVNGKYCPAVKNWGAVGSDAEWVKFKNALSPTTDYDEKPQIYRIRKSWAAADTQIGAYKDLNNAKRALKAGYHIYDANGNEIM